MLNLGGGEMLAILLLALIVLGPERLPKAARQVGTWMRELRRLSAGFQEEIRNVIDLDADDDPADRYRQGDKPFRRGQEALGVGGDEIVDVGDVGDLEDEDAADEGGGDVEVSARHEVDKPVSPGGPADLRVVPDPGPTGETEPGQAAEGADQAGPADPQPTDPPGPTGPPQGDTRAAG
jgi:Tat protein translocase TatB subunit